MRRIKKWIVSHRERRLRERLLKTYGTPLEAEIAFRYIKNGEVAKVISSQNGEI
jgi:hypothetical protein